MNALLEKLDTAIAAAPGARILGRVSRVTGLIVEVAGLDQVSLGEVCRIEGRSGRILAEVVAFTPAGTLLMPYGDLVGIHPGATVRALGRSPDAPVGEGLLGRVINAYGEPIDGKGPIVASSRRTIFASPPSPLDRRAVSLPAPTGVRAIDSLLTLGQGQRIGIMAGSGVGKSVLLGMIAKNTNADASKGRVNVIALLGERGREVGEFITRDLGPEGLARSVVIVATGDEGALLRARGALVATTVAEHFRDEGRDVMLMVDSITRVAMAWREIGLAVGEPPATRGYPPSVFAMMPRLLERAGNSASGSITGIYTVLVEGDDMNEPVADAARSILDGHIVLSADLAAAGHFPSIDILRSKSRVRDAVIDTDHRERADALIKMEAAWAQDADLISVGQYKKGSNPELDTAIEFRPHLLEFLRQRPEVRTPWEEMRGRLDRLAVPVMSALKPR